MTLLYIIATLDKVALLHIIMTLLDIVMTVLKIILILLKIISTLVKIILLTVVIKSLGQFKALYTAPPGRPVHSNTITTSLGSIQPYAAITAHRLFVHISTSVAMYLFVQLSELGRREVNTIANASKRQKEDSNPGSLK